MGQKRLEQAVEHFGRDKVKVEWKPYMIDPGTNPQGEEFEAYNRRRWGGSGWTHHLKQEGRKDGANFNDWKWWPNTLHAHQFVAFASENGVSTAESNQVLFESLYEEGENISLVDTLVAIGKNKLNLDETELRTYLEDEETAKQVKKEMSTGRSKYGISGVPFFIIDGNAVDKPYAFSGAQPSATFLEVFDEVNYDEK